MNRLGHSCRIGLASPGVDVRFGCSAATQRNEDFVPPEEAALAALEAYLEAWTARQHHPDCAGHATRRSWWSTSCGSKGRTLTGSQVLGPVPADAPRCFAVRLTLGNPAEEVRERYVVVGMDPLWVWRYDDYLMITHWEHPMPDEKDGEEDAAAQTMSHVRRETQ